MKRTAAFLSQWIICIFIPSVLIIAVFLGNKAITAFSETAPISDRTIVVIDAGHGGIDGGAVSCTGAMERDINLDIALRLQDLCHLLGIGTRMIRTTPESVETQGQTIAQKKISDLKNRVKIVNDTSNAILVSIHQNHFPDSKYSGAQVFYKDFKESQALAKRLQEAFVKALNPGSKRKIKKASGIYLMDKIQTTAVLIECGFLSNPQEEARLRTPQYQKQLCCVIASQISTFMQSRNTP